MGDKYGSSNNLPNNNQNSKEEGSENSGQLPGTFRDRVPKWVSGGTGGFLGGIVTVLFIINPTVTTWLQNAKEAQQAQREIALAQVKTNQEQINYITKRMEDSDHERDLYKTEMLNCQKELRELKK